MNAREALSTPAGTGAESSTVTLGDNGSLPESRVRVSTARTAELKLLRTQVLILEDRIRERDRRLSKLRAELADVESGRSGVADYLGERIEFTEDVDGDACIATQDVTVSELCAYASIPTQVSGVRVPPCAPAWHEGLDWTAYLTSYDGLNGVYQVVGGVV